MAGEWSELAGVEPILQQPVRDGDPARYPQSPLAESFDDVHARKPARLGKLLVHARKLLLINGATAGVDDTVVPWQDLTRSVTSFCFLMLTSQGE